MPRDSGDDAYEWMAARDRATTTVETGSAWAHRKTRKHVRVINGGFLPSYEGSDASVRYVFIHTTTCVHEMHVQDFVNAFRPRKPRRARKS